MRKYLLILGFLSVIYNAYGQDYPELYNPELQTELGILPSNLIQISNYVTNRIAFSMSYDQKNWKTFKVHQYNPILVDLKKNRDAFFRICTSGDENKCIEYKLRGSRRYRIYWNQKAQRWDLTKFSNTGQ